MQNKQKIPTYYGDCAKNIYVVKHHFVININVHEMSIDPSKLLEGESITLGAQAGGRSAAGYTTILNLCHNLEDIRAIGEH